jgi:Homeodomain-like domain
MRRPKLEGRRIARAPLDFDREQVIADRRSRMSLTEVAKEYRVSRATVCRLVAEFGGEKKPGVPQVSFPETAVSAIEGNDLQTAA